MSKPVQLIWPANFFIHLAVYRYFRLPNLKFGLPFGHWQAAISSPDKEHEKILITRARAKEKLWAQTEVEPMSFLTPLGRDTINIHQHLLRNKSWTVLTRISLAKASDTLSDFMGSSRWHFNCQQKSPLCPLQWRRFFQRFWSPRRAIENRQYLAC